MDKREKIRRGIMLGLAGLMALILVFGKNEKEDIDTCWYGCSVSLCVLASSGNYGFAGPFVFGRQR